MNSRVKYAQKAEDVSIAVSSKIAINGSLNIVEGALGVIIFANVSGSSRYNSRNCFVAEEFNRMGMDTLLIDLFTAREEETDLRTGQLRFDVELLTKRIKAATKWIMEGETTKKMKIGYFASSAAAAAALSAAAELGDSVRAVASRGGRCDLAECDLSDVKAPVLFITGQYDTFVNTITSRAVKQMKCENKVVVIEGATHLFEEPGAIEEVADAASTWFAEILSRK